MLLREATQVPAASELRQVVVMFADLANYTGLADLLQPEDIHDLLTRFFDVVDGTIAEHGGSIDKHIGDNVMALFGAPVAHGDDAERAVRAALAIHERVHGLGRELGLQLEMHVGIAAGQVMASRLVSTFHTEYTVVGGAVNVSARLQARAAAAETLIDGNVQRRVVDIAELERVGDLTLKGIGRPVSTWRLQGLRPERVVAMTPMIGREEELREVRDVLADCAARSAGQVVVLRGEAGIGKSRLVRAAEAAAIEQGYRCHRAEFLDYGGSRTAVAHLLAELVSAPECRPERRLEPLEYAALCDIVGAPVPDGQRRAYAALDTASRTAVRRAATAQLTQMSATRVPRLLVLEDMHWIDADSLTLAPGLLQATVDAAVVVLMTTRPAGRHPLPWQDDERIQVRLMELSPLSAEESAELVASLGVERRLMDEAVERGGGNPLFLEELVACATEPDEPAHLPGSLHSLVLARLDSLQQSDREALQVASVLGRQFSPHHLSALLAPGPAYSQERLLGNPLLIPVADGFMFRHALIRDGVYESLPRERRGALHRRAAAIFGDGDRVLQARHLDHADAPEAPEVYRQAAEQLATGHQYEFALELLERARELARGSLLQVISLARGRVLEALGRIRAALDAYRSVAETATDQQRQCQALIGVAACHRSLSQTEDALEVLARAESCHPDGRQLATIRYHRSSIFFITARFVEAAEQAQQAVELARQEGEPGLMARALSALGDSEFGHGSMRRANRYFGRCLELCEQHGLTRFALINRIMYADTMYWMGDAEGAIALCEQILTEAVQVRYRFAEMFVRHERGILLQFQGQPASAREEFALAIGQARSLGSARFEYEMMAMIALTEFELGADSVAQAREAVALSRTIGLDYCGPLILGILGQVTADEDERRQAFDEAQALLDGGSMSVNHFYFYQCAIASALAREDYESALHYAGQYRAVGHRCDAATPIREADVAEEHARAALAARGPGDW